MRCNVMRLKSVLLIKRSLTELTVERLVRCVCSFVCVQRGSQCKSLAAYVTLKWPFTRVAVHVCFQISLLVESLATELTTVHAHVGMCPHVIRQVRQLFKSPPTFLTLVRLLTCVGVAVNLHVDFLVKPLAAEIAAEGLVVGVGAHVSV